MIRKRLNRYLSIIPLLVFTATACSGPSQFFVERPDEHRARRKSEYSINTLLA